ncbi:MAG: YiiX/YebB-like N1pC/P60 family cysteine hydrolase [Pseudomonadota bacterium]
MSGHSSGRNNQRIGSLNPLAWIGRRIVGILQTTVVDLDPVREEDIVRLRTALEPGDVLLVEGTQYLSTAIKYLTMSTWSHAALYVGPVEGAGSAEEPHELLDVTLDTGVVTQPLSLYANHHTRICRAVSLSQGERQAICDYALARVGQTYDVKNVVDLARYLVPTPPVPSWFRRRMIALGSGDPTRAICSTLIAQAFQSIRYPILPAIETIDSQSDSHTGYTKREILHIRHHSLFAPRDFDISPYFEIIKPSLAMAFDHRKLTWADPEIPEELAMRDGRPPSD